MTEQEKLKAAEQRIIERNKHLPHVNVGLRNAKQPVGPGTGNPAPGPTKQRITVNEANWGSKREKILTILKMKGMDSQQVEQAMSSIDQIMWGT